MQSLQNITKSLLWKATLPVIIVLTGLLVFTQIIRAQGSDTITSVSPSQAAQDATNVTVTITLVSNIAPSNDSFSSLKIGNQEAGSHSYSQPTITAIFNDFNNETPGLKDVTLQFSSPQGTQTLTKSNGFEITCGSGGNVAYVDIDNASGTYNGASWATAYQSVQEGIDAVFGAGGGEVWIAEGTYKTTATSSRTVSIQLQACANVYGGFGGIGVNETLRNQRNYTNNVTILSGDIGVADNSSDNAYHVIVGADNVTLDGFTITGGNAAGTERYHTKGGGMINYDQSDNGLSPTMNNLIFSGNQAEEGGAIYNFSNTPTISNSVFSNNSAQKGGAIANQNAASPVINNATFSNNYADWRGGAIFIDYGSSPTVTNTIFLTNTTGGHGGAVYVDNTASQHGGTYPNIDGSTFTNNSAVFFGGAIQAYNGSTPTVSDSAFNNNSSGAGGGAIAVRYNTTAYLTDITYSGNSSTQNEADVYVDSSSSIISTTSTTSGTAYAGYNLYTPLASTETYLMDNDGNNVYTWTSNYNPGNSVYLLEDGTLLRTGKVTASTPFSSTGGVGGIVEIITSTGAVSWSYQYATADYQLHHDVALITSTGNVLMIAWEHKTDTEAIAAGRDPNPSSSLKDGELWPDKIIEVQPTGPNTGTIVWEWHVWDHLVQDDYPAKPNYKADGVSAHLELIDLNYLAGNGGADWNHTNSIAYKAEFDQILLSVREFEEIWIIDHSAATAEAAGHTGGTYGRGGDLLYRWGNTQAYGITATQQLFVQHNAHWIEAGYPGAGNILIFNNGQGRTGGADYSSVDEIIPPVTITGSYTLTGATYSPAAPTWSYQAPNPTDFYGANISGAQRLPNGNTLICEGPDGYFFEVTTDKQTVWTYQYTGNPASIFRVTRYATDYAGLP